MFNKSMMALALLCATSAYANIDVPITGNVESKCVITTDTPGVYGNPVTNKLSTLPTDGGVDPIVRYDIIEAGAYKAKLAYPIEFTSAPALNDVVNWEGAIEVAEVSDVQMTDFETNKIQWENVTEFDLTIAGSVWFKTSSIAEYGYGKSFPGGTYRSSVVAECIAQ